MSGIPTYIPPVKRLIAIGDLHGDFKATVLALRLAKVIDSHNHWCGGKAVVIQLGDQIDRGGRSTTYKDENSELKIMNLFDNLAREAKLVGGACYSLMGNHELMNVQGNFQCVTKKGIEQFGGNKERKRFFKIGSPMAIRMANTRNAIMRIGDFVFVHGGISPRLASKYRLEEINNIMREYLMGRRKMDKQIEELFCDDNSILWCRRYSDARTDCKSLYKTLEILGAKNMVVAHTPQDNGINCKCNTKVWRIDTAMSEAFGKREDKDNRIQVLEILDNGSKINILK